MSDFLAERRRSRPQIEPQPVGLNSQQNTICCVLCLRTRVKSFISLALEHALDLVEMAANFGIVHPLLDPVVRIEGRRVVLPS